MAEHQHWSPEEGKFITHSHLHAGAHKHDVAMMQGRPVLVTVKGPGNYAPPRRTPAEAE